MQITSRTDPFPSPPAAATPASRPTQKEPVEPARDQPVPDQNAIKAAVEVANRAMLVRGAQVQFSIDNDSGRTLVRVVDTETKKVLRQIPSEEMIAIARNIDRMLGANVADVA